jgi:hypothetical protein
MTPGWFNLKQAHSYTGISVAKLRKLIYTGQLQAYKPQAVKKNFIKREDLDSLMMAGMVKL